jgi:hypothetical protein
LLESCHGGALYENPSVDAADLTHVCGCENTHRSLLCRPLQKK